MNINNTDVKHLSIYFFILLSWLLAPQARAYFNQAKADSIASTLSRVSAPADSIRILLDVYDLAEQKRKPEVAERILDLAVRTKDHVVMADIIRQLSVLKVRDANRLRRLLDLAKQLPEDRERKAVELFVKMELATNEATYTTEEERVKYILKYAKEDMTPNGDLYEDLIDLGRMVFFLGRAARGSMYIEYLQRLEEMIELLPEDHFYVRNLLCTAAANFYTQNNNPQKGVEFDRLLLKQIGKLEKLYAEKGRKYRNFDRYYYICYRRMLRNYKALPLQEVKDLYARCAILADKDDDINSDFYGIGRPTVYRLLAEKDYKGVIPHIKKSLESASDDNLKRELLGALVEASDSIGDNETLSDALQECNHMLEEKLRLESEVTYRELQIRYDVNNLRAERDRLEKDKTSLEMATDQKVISISLAALFVLAIIVMLLYRSNFKLRRKLYVAKEENKSLQANIESILDNGTPQGSRDVRDIMSGNS